MWKGENSEGEECKDNINVWTELAKSRMFVEDKEERESKPLKCGSSPKVSE